MLWCGWISCVTKETKWKFFKQNESVFILYFLPFYSLICDAYRFTLNFVNLLDILPKYCVKQGDFENWWLSYGQRSTTCLILRVYLCVSFPTKACHPLHAWVGITSVVLFYSVCNISENEISFFLINELNDVFLWTILTKPFLYSQYPCWVLCLFSEQWVLPSLILVLW